MPPGPRPRLFLGLGAILAGVLLGLTWKVERSSRADTSDYDRALARVDVAIRVHSRREAERGSPSWLDFEQLALAHLAKGHLSQDVKDYNRAEEAIQQAFKLVSPGTGPFLTRAKVSFALHRYDQALLDLDFAERALIVPARTRSAIEELRASALEARGERLAAERSFERGLASKRTPSLLARFASFRWREGHESVAEALFEEARALAVGGEELAWIEVQRGALCLEQDDFACALSRYRRAASAFTGWWLVEKHIAEANARHPTLKTSALGSRSR